MLKYLQLISIFFICISFKDGYGQCDANQFQGEGTYYGYSGGGNCSFPNPYGNLHSGALNASQYKGAVLCGACVKLSGEKGTIYLSIEDQCPECKAGDIDLEEDAFPLIADKIKGRVPIFWSIVSCPYEGPIAFYFKEGSSQYWTAVQIRNSKNPISTVEYLKNDQYILLERSDDNFFKALQGMGIGPYTFRITDYFGNVVQESNIPLTLTTTIPGKNQFPDCGISGVSNEMVSEEGYISVKSNHGELVLSNHTEVDLTFSINDLLGKNIKMDAIPAKSNITINLPSNSLYFVVASWKNQLIYHKAFLY